MAKGRIDYESLVNADLNAKFKQLFDTINDGANKSEATFKRMLESSVNVSKQIPTTAKEVQAFNKAIQDQQRAVIGLQKVEQERLKTKQQEQKLLTNEAKEKDRLVKVEQQRIATLKRLSAQEIREKEKLLKVEKREIENKRKLNSEYEQAKIKLNKLAQELKELAFVEGKNAKSTRKLAREYDLLRGNIFSAEKVAGQFQRNVGKYPKFIGGATNALRSMGLAFGALQIVRNVITSVREFEVQNATLAGVLGVTREQTLKLAASQIKYGSSTQYTAKQVGGLQTAYARLGLSQDVILGVTEGTLNLATALESGLGDTATLVGSTMKSFGLDVSDTENIVNSLTRSTQKSSLDFVKLSESLSFVAPTAKTLKETLGMLGVLTDNGIKASRSGRLLSSSFLRLAKDGRSLEEGLNDITNAQKQGKTSLEVAAIAAKTFGKESATLGIILADNKDKVKDLTAEIKNNANAAKDLAEEKLKTLDGSIKLLTSAWDSYILKLNDSTQGGNILSKSLAFLAENLETVLNVVGTLLISFASFKIASGIWTAGNFLMTASQAIFSTTVVTSTVAVKGFNTAMKANIFGLIIALIAGAVASYYAFADSLSTAEIAQNRLNKATKEGIDYQKKKNALIKTETDKALADAEKSSEKSVLLGKNEIQAEKDLLAEKLKILEVAKKSNQQQQKDNRDDIKLREEISLRNIGILDKEVKRLQEVDGLRKYDSRKEAERLKDKIEKIRLNNEAQTRELEARNGELFNEELNISKRIEAQKESNSVELLKIKKKENSSTKQLNDKAYSERVKEANDLEMLRKRTEDLRIQAIKDNEEREVKAIETKYKREREAIKGETEIEINLRSQLEINLQLELAKIKDKYAQEEADRKQKQFDDDIRAQEKIDAEILKNKVDFQKKAADAARAEIAANKKNKKEEKAQEEKDLLNKRLDNVTKASGLIGDALQKEADRRIALLDKELEANKTFQSEIANLSAQGIISATENIAFEKKKSAELELLKQRELELQAKRELVTSAVTTYAGYIQGGESGANALASTITDISVLKSFINTLDFFLDGTENTGTVSNPLDSNGGRLAILHNEERVMTKEQNRLVSHLSNDELATLGSTYKVGNENVSKALKLERFDSNDAVLTKFDELKAVVKQSASETHFNYDNIKDSFLRSVKTHNKIENYNYKKSKLF
mgnify:CR=1 FL=1